VIFAVLEVSFWALTTVVKLLRKFLTLIVTMSLVFEKFKQRKAEVKCQFLLVFHCSNNNNKCQCLSCLHLVSFLKYLTSSKGVFLKSIRGQFQYQWKWQNSTKVQTYFVSFSSYLTLWIFLRCFSRPSVFLAYEVV